MAAAVELFFALVSLLLGAAGLNGSTKAWHLESHPIDLAMRFLAALWILYVLTAALPLLSASRLANAIHLAPYIHDAIFAALMASLAFFLLTASGGVRPWVLGVVAMQLLVSLAATVWQNAGATFGFVYLVATAFNLLGAAAVAGSVMRQVRHTHSRRSWLALAACAMGIGLWLSQAAEPAGAHTVLPIAFHLYGFFMFVVWKLLSLNPDADKALASPGVPALGGSAFQSLSSTSTGTGSDDDFSALAVRGERQRIAYELHDNIGSQIVSILFSMQAAEQPQKRFVMMSLEQCLADLKMTVDALDGFDENVTQALGRLRYRVQPALDRQCIQLRWDIDMSAELEAVQGIYAQQVLRIAQESLSNVMRHAKASSVKVACRFEPEFSHLLLEVCDDGVGTGLHKSNAQRGRGLDGMKRRARAVGGFLTISNHGGGTCVRLTLPLLHVKMRPASATPGDVKAAAAPVQPSP